MNLNETVKVVGKSKKGKERVKQHGDTWTVVRVSSSVLCLDSRPGVLLQVGSYQRWMALENDRDFKI